MTLRLPKAALCAVLPLFAAPAFAHISEGADPKTEEPKTEEAKAEASPDAIIIPEVKTEEKKICKRIATDMSSRRRTKVCKTREEWKVFNRQQRGRSN